MSDNISPRNVVEVSVSFLNTFISISTYMKQGLIELYLTSDEDSQEDISLVFGVKSFGNHWPKRGEYIVQTVENKKWILRCL